MTPETLLEAIVRTADAKKARDIMAMRVYEQTTLTDYFVVMTGGSHRKEMKLKKEHEITPHHIEGVTSNWILMDYSSVVVHIFLEEARELYAIERLWSDGQKVDIEPYLLKKEEG